MKPRVLLIVAVLVCSALLGCSASKGNLPATKSIEVSLDDVRNQSVIGRDIALAVGDKLKLTLGSNRTTPYGWTADAKIGDPAVVKQTSHEYVRGNSDLMGAPGNEVWMFTASKPGTTTIVTDYASIVGSDPTPVCTFTATVTVK